MQCCFLLPRKQKENKTKFCHTTQCLQMLKIAKQETVQLHTIQVKHQRQDRLYVNSAWLRTSQWLKLESNFNQHFLHLPPQCAFYIPHHLFTHIYLKPNFLMALSSCLLCSFSFASRVYLLISKLSSWIRSWC